MLLGGNSGRKHIGWGEEQRRGKGKWSTMSLSGFWKEGSEKGRKEKQKKEKYCGSV